MILAPTGASATLISGSTYHHVLGINEFNERELNDSTALTKVKSRLEGVDYMFIDEVSMMSCRDLQKIHERLSKVLNEFDEPFGGLNVIFAGDFAQLPPVGGKSLYSYAVGRRSWSPTASRDQIAAC